MRITIIVIAVATVILTKSADSSEKRRRERESDNYNRRQRENYNSYDSSSSSKGSDSNRNAESKTPYARHNDRSSSSKGSRHHSDSNRNTESETPYGRHNDRSSSMYSRHHSDSNRNTESETPYDCHNYRSSRYWGSRHFSVSNRNKESENRVTKFTAESRTKNSPEIYNVKYDEKGKVECCVSNPIPPSAPFIASFYAIREKKDKNGIIDIEKVKCTRPGELSKKYTGLTASIVRDICQKEVADKWASFYCDGQLTWCGDRKRHLIDRESSPPGWHVVPGTIKYYTDDTCDNPFVKIA